MLYRRHEDLRLTELEDEGIVLHLGSRKYFSVSETGLQILKALDHGELSESELVASLMESYAVAQEEALESVREFLAKCSEARLVIGRPDG